MSGFLKNKKLVTILLCTVLLLITIVVAGVAVWRKVDQGEQVVHLPSSQSNPQSSSAGSGQGDGNENAGENTGESGDGTAVHDPIYFNRPSTMRAVYITAGVDYLTDGDLSAEKIKADIDTALANAKELTMNTVIFDLKYEDRSIYLQSALPTVETDFDILEYAVSKAREQGFYIYAIYDTLDLEQDGGIVSAQAIDSQVVETVTGNAVQFATSYDIDGVLLDDYYCETQDTSYATYLKKGGGIGFDNYLKGATQSVFTTIADAIRTQAPHLQIGLLTEEVWANQSQNEDGSATSAAYTTLGTGNSDNRSYVEQGYVDFIAVKAYSPTTSGTAPFSTVAKWWGNLAAEYEIPYYIVHASSKLCSEEAGWTEYDQLTKQLIATESVPGYSGSIFNSLARMVENPENSASTAIGYFKDEINVQHVLTELAVTVPQQKTFTTFEQSVTFKGASDPNTEITINGVKVSTDQNGYFTVNKALEPGLNQFTFVHKGRSEIYNITRQVVVLKEASPEGNMTIDGGMKVTITALAYSDAKVYATVGGQTIQMTKMSAGDDDVDRDTSYVRFSGTYTAPEATTAVQDIGQIIVYGEAQGQKDVKECAYLKVNKKVVVGDGTPIQVVAEQAETFPTSVINDFSDPNYFPLPQGTLDYSVGSEIVYKNGDKTYSYYQLASDLRVYTKDIKAVSDNYAVDSNVISGMTVTADERYTKVIFNTQQQVSYKGSYDNNSFKITFNYTSSHPGNMTLTKNPLFSSATWSGSTLTLQLRKTGGFLGYTAYYDSSGNLVMRFNNPPEISGSSLAGAKIVVDPGHGGSDPGAPGFLPAYPEKVITRDIAEKLVDELKSRGASVYYIETNASTSSKVVVQTRMELARDYDPHLMVSIHCNSTDNNSTAVGTEVYYFNQYSKAFAGYSSSAIASALGTSNRGAKFGYYYVTRDPQFPAVLCETGFLSNEREYKKLIDEDYQYAIASGIADSISQFFKYTGSTGSNLTGTQQSGEAVSQVPVTDMELDVGTLSLKAGESETINPVVTPSDASNQKVTYKSSDTSVATVNSNGEVTGVSAGTATITATTDDGGFQDSCKVTVTGQASSSSGGSGGAVTGVSLDYDELELEKGDTYKLGYTIKPSNASNQKVYWESDDTSVAKVSQNGTITAVDTGQALISIMTEDGEYWADCLVSVVSESTNSGKAPTELVFNSDYEELYVGDTCVLKVTYRPAGSAQGLEWVVDTLDGDNVVTYTTSGNTITLKAKSPGEVLVTAVSQKDSSVFAECTILVSPE